MLGYITVKKRSCSYKEYDDPQSASGLCYKNRKFWRIFFMEHLYVPRNEVSTLHILSHWSLAVALLSRYCFIDEEKESQISNMPRSYWARKWQSWGWNLSHLPCFLLLCSASCLLIGCPSRRAGHIGKQAIARK